MCVVAWPARLPAQSEPRQQYVHAVDIVPTIYELLDVDPPEVLKGYPQSPMDGQSVAAVLTDADAPGRETQFYAMLGQRAIYHQGWLACTVHPPLSGWGSFDRDVWELYDLGSDRAQSRNVADQEPERLAMMRDLWHYHAGVSNGLPLDDRSALEHVLDARPSAAKPRSRYVYYPIGVDVPEESGVPINGRSYTIVAGAELDSEDAHGVLFAHGGVIGGHSLYLKDRRLHYDFNWVGTKLQEIVADRDITAGRHVFSAEFELQGKSDDPDMPGFAGTVTLYIDENQVGRGDIVTQPGAFCLVGDGICVGRDSGSPVTPAYQPPFRFTGGTIDRVIVDVSGDHYVDHEAQVRAWLMRD
jgi:hypothetical protein